MTTGGLAARLAHRARERMHADFLRLCASGPQTRILDVGVSDVMRDEANMLERLHAWPEAITAVGLGEARAFQAAFPRVRYQRIAPGAALPFADDAFDLSVSNAVLEHVGSEAAQRHFLAELLRVGKRSFVTVPNRYFPVEHHTAIPFAHWSDRLFPPVCRLLGKAEWGRAENLIPMSRARLAALVPPGRAVQIGTTGLTLGPFSSNLYLIA
ncbi:MAG: methyltransferase domain-containing protein [Rhodospirillales bacterium]|nr:methyltransferase domain-containing protein [Rhodospirillales bacterium]